MILTLSSISSLPPFSSPVSLQNQHPNPVGTHYADSGFHGSKFVSVVVSGAEDNSIVPNAYQASTHAMALTRGEETRGRNGSGTEDGEEERRRLCG